MKPAYAVPARIACADGELGKLLASWRALPIFERKKDLGKVRARPFSPLCLWYIAVQEAILRGPATRTLVRIFRLDGMH